MITERFRSAGTYASILSGKLGATDVAATSICNIGRTYQGTMESGVYAAEFDNGSALIVGIYDGGMGVINVSAAMSADISGLEMFPGLEIIK